jgi:hypothetical protein
MTFKSFIISKIMSLKDNDLYSRLNTLKKTSSSASLFTQAKPGTKYGTIYKTNMDDSSFNEPAVSINKTIQMSNQAYFGRLDRLSPHQKCQVKELFHTYLSVS